MGQRQSADAQPQTSKKADPRPLTPFNPEKGTPEIFTRIVYINQIASFYGGEIFDAIFLASLSRTFREAVQAFAPQLWYEIREQIEREPGFQNVVLSIARNHGDTLHWIVDRLFEKKSNLDVNFVLINKRPLLIEALQRKNTPLVKKLLLELGADWKARSSCPGKQNAMELTLTDLIFSFADREYYLKLLFSVGARIDPVNFSSSGDRSEFEVLTQMLERSMVLIVAKNTNDGEKNAEQTKQELMIRFVDEEFLMNIIQCVTTPTESGSDRFIFQTLSRLKQEMFNKISSSSSVINRIFNADNDEIKKIAATRIEDLFIKVIDKFFAANLHYPHKILEPSHQDVKSNLFRSLTLATLISDCNDSSPSLSARIYKVLLNHSRMMNKVNFGKDYPFFYEVNQRGLDFNELPDPTDVSLNPAKGAQFVHNSALAKNLVLDDRKKAYNAIELAILMKRFELVKLFCEEGRAKMTRSLTVVEQSAEETETLFAFAERVYRHHDGRKPVGDEKQILEYLEDRIAVNNENSIDDDDKGMVKKSEAAYKLERDTAKAFADLMEHASALRQFSQPETLK